MKFDQLRSIGHNIADSLASGIGLPIGFHETNVFAEAKRQTGQAVIIIDFLTGTCASGLRPLPSLARLRCTETRLPIYASGMERHHRPSKCSRCSTPSTLSENDSS
jgi:hypothetical protein